jgi:hypothetical protein
MTTNQIIKLKHYIEQQLITINKKLIKMIGN